MKSTENIKLKAEKKKVKVKSYPGILPEGVLMPAKLAIATKVLNSIKNIKTVLNTGK